MKNKTPLRPSGSDAAENISSEYNCE